MYKPTTFLMEGISNAFPLQLMPWDHYFATMAEDDFLSSRAELNAVKPFFVREAPFRGAYTLLGGLNDAMRTISELRFDSEDFMAAMLDTGSKPEFVNWLARQRRLRLRVFSSGEGEVFFPNEPIVVVEGPLAHVRLAEGVLTEALNFSSLSLTKWHRVVKSAGKGRVLDFSRRRAQNSIKSSLYAMLAGAYSTSNAELRRFFTVSLGATFGHEYPMGYGDVKAAFKAWLTHHPDRPIGLVDTTQCLVVDFPAWLDAVYEAREEIMNANAPIWGWRNDSGDLAYLTIEQFVRFFQHPLSKLSWFVNRMRIVLTNDLDEYAIESIVQQISSQAREVGFEASDILNRIIWAAGTKPGTASDQPALGGVMKLSEISGHAAIKLAFDANGRPGLKTSIPGFNRSAMVLDNNGELTHELIYPARRYEVRANGRLYDNSRMGELSVLEIMHPDDPDSLIEVKDYTCIPRQSLVYDSIDGFGFTDAWHNDELADVTHRIQTSVGKLHWTSVRLDQPHVVKVRLTPDLFQLRQSMIKGRRLRQDVYLHKTK